VLQVKRKVYSDIVNLTPNFRVKCLKYLEYNSRLTVGYSMSDYLNKHEINPIKKVISKFFIDEILSKLKMIF
jgi:hypothetical protein